MTPEGGGDRDGGATPEAGGGPDGGASPAESVSPGGNPPLSAVLITKNAERTLERTLAALGWVDEIVVVDSGSEDATAAIARRHGARFLERDWPGYGPQKRRAAEAATGDWILSVDADEVVSPELAASIREAVASPGNHVAFRMYLCTEFLGTWLGSRGWWRDWKLRLYRSDRGSFNDEQVHEGISVEGPVGSLDGPLYHYAWRDVAHRLQKENAYATLSAIRDHRRGRRSGALRPFFRAAGWFVKEYLFRCGFLHGRAGLLHAGLTGSYAFQRAVKLHELTRRGGPDRSGGPDSRAGGSPADDSRGTDATRPGSSD